MGAALIPALTVSFSSRPVLGAQDWYPQFLPAFGGRGWGRGASETELEVCPGGIPGIRLETPGGWVERLDSGEMNAGSRQGPRSLGVQPRALARAAGRRVLPPFPARSSAADPTPAPLRRESGSQCSPPSSSSSGCDLEAELEPGETGVATAEKSEASVRTRQNPRRVPGPRHRPACDPGPVGPRSCSAAFAALRTPLGRSGSGRPAAKSARRPLEGGASVPGSSSPPGDLGGWFISALNGGGGVVRLLPPPGSGPIPAPPRRAAARDGTVPWSEGQGCLRTRPRSEENRLLGGNDRKQNGREGGR